jgi:hypothetical protein
MSVSAVGESKHLHGVLVEERKIEHLVLSNGDADVRHVGDGGIERSRLDGIRHGSVAAELSVREGRHLDAPRRAAFDQLLQNHGGFGVARRRSGCRCRNAW